MAEEKTIQQLLDEYNALAKEMNLEERKSFRTRDDATKALKSLRQRKTVAARGVFDFNPGSLRARVLHALITRAEAKSGPVAISDLAKELGLTRWKCLVTARLLFNIANGKSKKVSENVPYTITKSRVEKEIHFELQAR